MPHYALLLIPLLAGGLTDTGDMGDWLITRFDHSQPLGAARSVEISNPYGDIRTRTANDASVYVHAVIQRQKQDPPRLDIQVTEQDGAVIIAVVEKQPAEALPETTPPQRVDVAALVPPAAHLRISTRHGLAESKGHRADLRVETSDGKINVRTKGTLDARSERGTITATFQQRTWSGPSRIETHSGDITVLLLENPDVLVSIDTAGDITTDYSLNITPVPGSKRKEAVAAIGQAVHPLTLKSAVGNIKLSRLFDLLRSAPESVPAESGTHSTNTLGQ